MNKKENDHQLIKNIRPELKRTVTFALDNESFSERKNFKSDISYGISTINYNVNSHLNKISELDTINSFPVKINIGRSSPAWPIFEKDINDILSQLESCEDLRVIIKFNYYDSSLIKESVDKNNISHLVEINLLDNNENTNKAPDPYPVTSVKASSVQKVFEIIEDVMLDISMYHTFISPKFLQLNIDERRKFSLMKIELAGRKKLESSTWNINLNKNYISLAGFFRDEKRRTINYNDYLKCWEEISNEIKTEAVEIPQRKSYPSIENQLKRHKDYGQISTKRVIKLLEKKTSGAYLLIKITRKPKNIILRETILSYFRGSKWSPSKMNVVDFSMLDEIKRFSSWLSIFKIYKQ